MRIQTPLGEVPACIEGRGETGILLATGAGTGQDHPSVAGLRSRLARHYRVMTFEYAYRAAARKVPDRQPRLLAVHRAAAARLRQEVGERLVLAGRSLGGRMSTILASQGEPARAVVAYGYPLHPPGRPDRLRVEHLSQLQVPTLFLSGDRDALAAPALVDEHLASLPVGTLTWVEGADHSFRRRGTPPEEMLDHLVSVTVEWLQRL